jgi:glycosyltransferase involved in cell wall biosynthesis
MDVPRITVVTPTFNQGGFIEKTIDSVLSQGYPGLEFIVIDGGSTDRTVEVVRRHERHLAFWVSEPDRGQSHAINKGLARATGDYLTWLNSDDRYVPGALARFAAAAREHPGAGLIAGGGRIVDLAGRVLDHKTPPAPITVDTLYDWFEGGWFCQASCVFSREAWLACGPIEEQEHMAMDLDLWLKIARAGHSIVSFAELQSEVLSHPDAKTTAFENLSRAEGLFIIAKHGGLRSLRTGLEKMSRQLDEANARVARCRSLYDKVAALPLTRVLRPLLGRLRQNERSRRVEKIPPWRK